jgi:pSer/pThr/pTyr-binding forkhead associated (FHA) protein/TolA-binding protein
MKLIIEDDEGRKTVVPFVREEISIGRQEGNTIRLTERNVSRKHARLLRSNGSVEVEDLGSFNGVKVNGDRIEGRLPVQEGDLIEIGDYDLAIENEATDAPPNGGVAAQDTGRAPTLPGTNGSSVTPASGRAATKPGGPDDAPDDDGGPPRSQSTAVIRTNNLADQAREVRDLAPEERPKIVIVSGDQAGQECVLEKSVFGIGRTNGDNDLAINHRSISRNHAKLVLEADGSWHAIDLQSANGLRVNGEDYADAPIASGDLLEFGHVKVRFVGPGETYNYTAEDERTPTPRRAGASSDGSSMKLYGIIGGGVAVVAIAAGLYFVLGNKPQTPKVNPHVSPPLAANPLPAAHPTLPLPPGPAPLPSAPPTPAVTQTPEPAPPAEEPEKPAKVNRRQLAEWISAGKAAIKAHQLPVAEEKLKAAQDMAPDDPGVARLEKLLQAAKDREEQRAERQKNRKPAAAAPAETNEEPAEEAPAPTPKVDKHAKAVQTYQDALALMSSKDYRGAVVKLQKALTFDSGMADAHKAIGICYAKLNEPDKGAVHYEQYIKLKPNAPDAATVRAMLKAYYQQHGQ